MKARLIIEIAGSPKEHIEGVMKQLVSKIMEEKKILKYDLFEAQEREKMFFTFTEVDIEFQNTEELLGFCMDYLPSSVEILDENSIEIKREEFENIVNDLLAKLHQNDMTLKNLKAELMLKKNN